MKPVPAEASIIPSIPMLTTPARSHQRPAIAPRATGVPRRSDSTSSCMTLVSLDAERASARTTTSGTNSTAETMSAPLARRGERRSKNVASAASDEHDADDGDRHAGVERELQRVRRRLEGDALVGGLEVAGHVADQDEAQQPEDDAERLPATELELPHVVDPQPEVSCVVSSAVVVERRTRKMVRTITSAATKSRTSAWTIRTTSIDSPLSCCISPAPASIEPHRIDVRMMPKGLARASRAMAMASNPMPTKTPGLRNPDVPGDLAGAGQAGEARPTAPSRR